MLNLNAKTFRIKFEKSGVAKYISHLDLNRLFCRSLARAGIEVVHSEGFNPHPKIVFASAISLGVESFCEFVDVKTNEIETPEQFRKKISGDFFPQGILFHRIYEPETKFKDIDSTAYSIFIKPDGFGAGELNKLFGGDVFIEKKPGLNINLKDYICEIYALCSVNEECREYPILINAVIRTNQEMFLNPENIVRAVSAKYNIGDYFIRKQQVYVKNGGVFM